MVSRVSDAELTTRFKYEIHARRGRVSNDLDNSGNRSREGRETAPAAPLLRSSLVFTLQPRKSACIAVCMCVCVCVWWSGCIEERRCTGNGRIEIQPPCYGRVSPRLSRQGDSFRSPRRRFRDLDTRTTKICQIPIGMTEFHRFS